MILCCEVRFVYWFRTQFGQEPSDVTKDMITKYLKVQESIFKEGLQKITLTKTTKDFELFQERVLKARGSVKSNKSVSNCTDDTLVGTKELQTKNKNKVLIQLKYKTKVESQLGQEWKEMRVQKTKT